MNRQLFISGLLMGISWVSTLAQASSSSDLQQRLNKVNSFHSYFIQEVTTAEGVKVQEGEGELWIKRPNLFNWHMHEPDESILVSDGKTLWFYNPFVEQVTAIGLNDATSNTPFMLITRNDAREWAEYEVKRQGDIFDLIPKNPKNNLKQFSITVTSNGTINGFTTVEQDGQRSAYQLKSQQSVAIDASKFQFTPPPGVTLDDQRQ